MSVEPNNKNSGLFVGPFTFHSQSSFLLDFMKVSVHTD